MNKEEIIDIQRQDAHSILESLEYHLNHPPNTIIWEFRMGSSQVELLCAYVRQLEDKLTKINTIISNIDEKRLPKYQDKICDIKFCLEYDFWDNQKAKCDREMSPEELEIHNILLEKIKKEGG